MVIKYFLLIFYLINYTTSIKFYFNEPPKSLKCLGEYLSEGTLGKQQLSL